MSIKTLKPESKGKRKSAAEMPKHPGHTRSEIGKMTSPWNRNKATDGSSALKELLVEVEEREIMDELARRRLFDFLLATTPPSYLPGWFHEELCKELDEFLDDVVAEKNPRLIIEAPPRHGKSEIASRKFPAYSLGKYPNMSMICASYASDLASAMNRDVQRCIDSEAYARLFPETRLNGANVRTVADGSYLRNSDIFEIVEKLGVYKSAGVGSGITGRGGQCIIIDDPIKDAAEAHSQTVRDSIWEWFTSTLYTRLQPGGGIIIIMTRWHEDDLVGRLLKQMKEGGEQWRVVRFPARAETREVSRFTGEVLREEGDALHQGRYSLEQLARIEKAVGSKVWASLYQQNPSAASGNLFKRENWKYLVPPKELELMSHAERREYFHALGIRLVIQAWDTALGGKKKNDMTACTTLGIGPSKYFIIDVWKDKLQFPDALKQVELLFDKWRPHRVVVEGGGSASGKATVQTLNRSTRIPFKEVPTSSDKIFRADCISPTHEAGLVTIFQGAPWCAGFVDQCANFPNITNDDDVDSWMVAMEEALGGPKALNITSELLARLG